MANYTALTTIGVKVGYALETTDGTRPNTGYKHLKGLRTTPDFNVAPNTADVSTFENVEFTSKVGLLKEAPDNYEFGGVLSQGLGTDWKTLITAYGTGAKRMWFVIEVPGYDDAMYFSGIPEKLSFPSFEVNNAITDMSLFINADGGEPVVDTKPTQWAAD